MTALAASPSDAALMVASFRVFLLALLDSAGRPYEVPSHVLRWAELMETEPRLVLRAPRSHGKTTLLLAFIAWWCWRHGRDPGGRLDQGDPGSFEAIVFSATKEQALELMTRFRDLLIANKHLFADLLPELASGRRARTRWSASEVRLRNHARMGIRAFGTSVRGLHPDLLLLDDVLNDANSLGSEQRAKTHRFFWATLMPMTPGRIVIIGTAIHQDDLLARLSRDIGRGGDGIHTPVGFRCETYRALDEPTGETLWPERFPRDDLLALRDAEPLIFSREYQNEPRDDASSLFPYELTQRAIDAGANLRLGIEPADTGEMPVLGVDVARSETARADYTVAMVVAWNAVTNTRRILDVRREKGLDFDAQVELIVDLCRRHRVMAGMVENNGFQQWLLDALMHRPETRGRIYGHRTGTHKGDLQDGIPRFAMEFGAGDWIIPSGDARSLRLARQFQAELAAFGWKDGKLTGVGEHDDMVIAAWHVELAIRWVSELVEGSRAEYDILTGEDLGIEPVRIGGDY